MQNDECRMMNVFGFWPLAISLLATKLKANG